MIIPEYQEYSKFLEYYRGVVFGYVATDIMKYAELPPSGRIRDMSIHDHSFRDVVNGKLLVPEGPYKVEYHYNTNHEGYKLVKEATVIGPSQYDNLHSLIISIVDAIFPKIIERYASRDRDCTHCRDCADELVRKLIGYWGLHE